MTPAHLVTGDPTPGSGASGTIYVDEPDNAPVVSIEGGIYLYVGSVGGSAVMEFGVHARDHDWNRAGVRRGSYTSPTLSGATSSGR